MSIIQNLSGARSVVQVEGRVVDQNTSTQQRPVRNLDTGERISGKIISMSDENGTKNVQVRLNDNSVINARLSDGMSLKEGQFVSFEVRGASRSQITLTPLYENTSIDPTALKALAAAGLEGNQQNITMVRAMMENGMSIDKESLNSMHQAIQSNPGADVSSLVQMKALNIPINEQNINQFESYKNYEHQVVETMDQIMDELPEAYNELVQNGDPKTANDLYGNILKMISEGFQQMEENGQGEQTGQAVGQGAPNSSGEQAAVTSEQNVVNSEQNLQGAASDTTQTLINGDAKTADTVAETIVSGEGEASNEVVGEGGKASDVQSSEKSQDLQNGGKIADALREENPSDIKQDVRDIATGQEKASANAAVNDNGTNAATGMPPKTITLSNNLASLIKDIRTDAGLTGSEVMKLAEAAGKGESVEVDRAQLMKELSDAFSQNAHTSEAAGKAFSKIFSNDEYNKIMKDSLKDQWMLEPKDVGSKENVESLYNRLNTQAKQLTDNLTHILGSDSKAAQSAASLQSNIDFMNQLNEMFHYVQLPLKMADQDAHGDLYVYSNGKRKFEPGETVSAILHLDMDNLGPIDVYVKMKNTDVKTNFYVADEEIIDLIADHIDILNERLNKRGYTMDAKMMLHTDMGEDTEDAAVSEMLNIRKMPVISMQSFDARA